MVGGDADADYMGPKVFQASRRHSAPGLKDSEWEISVRMPEDTLVLGKK